MLWILLCLVIAAIPADASSSLFRVLPPLPSSTHPCVHVQLLDTRCNMRVVFDTVNSTSFDLLPVPVRTFETSTLCLVTNNDSVSIDTGIFRVLCANMWLPAVRIGWHQDNTPCQEASYQVTVIDCFRVELSIHTPSRAVLIHSRRPADIAFLMENSDFRQTYIRELEESLEWVLIRYPYGNCENLVIRVNFSLSDNGSSGLERVTAAPFDHLGCCCH